MVKPVAELGLSRTGLGDYRTPKRSTLKLLGTEAAVCRTWAGTQEQRCSLFEEIVRAILELLPMQARFREERAAAEQLVRRRAAESSNSGSRWEPDSMIRTHPADRSWRCPGLRGVRAAARCRTRSTSRCEACTRTAPLPQRRLP